LADGENNLVLPNLVQFVQKSPRELQQTKQPLAYGEDDDKQRNAQDNSINALRYVVAVH